MKKLLYLIFLLPVLVFGQQQTINIGTTANDGTGDPLRTAFTKTNANFTELYANVVGWGTAGGTDTYTLAADPTAASYFLGQKFSVIFTNANTTTATINVNSLGAKTLKKDVTTNLSAGDIKAGSCHIIMYDGTNFQVLTLGGSGSGSGTTMNNLPVEYQVNNYTLVPGDTSIVIVLKDDATTLTVGDFSTGVDGSQFVIYNEAGNTVTIDPDGYITKGPLEILDTTFAYIHFFADTLRISTAVAENQLTFSDGLTETGGAVSLGGTITSSTVITVEGSLQISNDTEEVGLVIDASSVSLGSGVGTIYATASALTASGLSAIDPITYTTPESLIVSAGHLTDKQYVDKRLAGLLITGSASLGQSIRRAGSGFEWYTPTSEPTASNGITYSGGNIKLGGELTEFTDITTDYFNIDWTADENTVGADRPGFSFFAATGDGAYGGLIVRSSSTVHENPVISFRNSPGDEFNWEGNRLTLFSGASKGIVYAGDDYVDTDSTLTDRRYVLAQLNPTNLTTYIDATAYEIDRASASTAGDIVLDMNSQKQRTFTGSATFATSKAISISNVTQAFSFVFTFEVTNVAATLSVPSNWYFNSSDYSSGVWTPPSAGKYVLSGIYDGTNWYLNINSIAYVH